MVEWEGGEKWRMIIYKEMEKEWWKKSCWWSKLRNKRNKSRLKKYLPSLVDDLPRTLACFTLLRRRSTHKPRIELSPHSHYIIKTNKNEVIWVLRRRTSPWTIVDTHTTLSYLCFWIHLHAHQNQKRWSRKKKKKAKVKRRT